MNKRTLANLSALSDEQIEAIRAVLCGQSMRPVEELWQTTRSRSHGAVQAVRVAMQGLGLESLIGSRPSPQRDAVCAMVAARVLAPHTKLATTRWWHTTTLAEEYGVMQADETDLYAAMDWLLGRQVLAAVGFRAILAVKARVFEAHRGEATRLVSSPP